MMANESEEFVRGHSHGWGKIPLQKSGGIRTFKVIEFDGPNFSDQGMYRIEIITARKATKELKYSLGYVRENAEWYRPESKYVNTPNFVVRSVAFPNRQYSKVLTMENMYFSSSMPVQPPDEVKPYLKSTILEAMDSYNNPYPTYREALEDIKEGRAYARAFSRRFLLMMNKNAKYPLLVYKNGLIGYDSGDLIVCTKESSALEELIRSATQKGVIFQ